MNLFSRIIALLLVLCQVADPVTASAWTPSVPTFIRVEQSPTVFVTQTVPAPSEWVPRIVGSIGQTLRCLAGGLKRTSITHTAAASSLEKARRFAWGVLQPRARRVWMIDHGFRESINAYQVEWERDMFVKSKDEHDSLVEEAKYVALYFVRGALTEFFGLHVMMIRYLLVPAGAIVNRLWRLLLRMLCLTR